MDAAEQLKTDLREGRLKPDRLADLSVASQCDLESAKRRIADLEKQLVPSATSKVEELYSLRGEEKQQDARDPKNPPGSPRRPGQTRDFFSDFVTPLRSYSDPIVARRSAFPSILL